MSAGISERVDDVVAVPVDVDAAAVVVTPVVGGVTWVALAGLTRLASSGPTRSLRSDKESSPMDMVDS